MCMHTAAQPRKRWQGNGKILPPPPVQVSSFQLAAGEGCKVFRRRISCWPHPPPPRPPPSPWAPSPPPHPHSQRERWEREIEWRGWERLPSGVYLRRREIEIPCLTFCRQEEQVQRCITPRCTHHDDSQPRYFAFSSRNLICRTLSLKCGRQLPQLSAESQRPTEDLTETANRGVEAYS